MNPTLAKMGVPEELLRKRIIWLDGKIDHEMASAFGPAIVWLNSQSEIDPIIVYIDSPGGNVDSGLDICDIVKHSKAPVVGTVYRRAASMAVVVLQVCQKRRAMKHSGILIHNIKRNEVPLDKLEDKDDFEDLLKEMRKKQQLLYDVLTERTGKTLKKVQAQCKKNEWLSAQEALSFGLIDEIL